MGECNLWLRSLGSLTSSPENMFQWNGCAFRKTMAVRVPGRVLSKIFLFFCFQELANRLFVVTPLHMFMHSFYKKQMSFSFFSLSPLQKAAAF